MSTLKDAIHDLFNNPLLTTDDAIDRHFAPGFRQRTNGHWDERAAFRARMLLLRDVVAHATVSVLDELVDGDRYAERHVIDLMKRDGERILQEVYVFAKRDREGRFTRIEETSFALAR
jgi:hypothetical protein